MQSAKTLENRSKGKAYQEKADSFAVQVEHPWFKLSRKQIYVLKKFQLPPRHNFLEARV